MLTPSNSAWSPPVKPAPSKTFSYFCEHPHVITLGRNANRSNLLASEHVLRQKNIELYSTNRGGDITYHGPGQIVGYPILNLDKIKRDVGWYVRTLEEAMIRASANFSVTAYRVLGKTGIWVVPRSLDQTASNAGTALELAQQQSSSGGGDFSPHVGVQDYLGRQPLKSAESTATQTRSDARLSTSDATEEKLAAIGVHISRWVTSHGFAYNVSTDLRYFDLIIPCGIADRKATSLEKFLQRPITPDEVKPHLTRHLADLIGRDPYPISREELQSQLSAAAL